MQAQSPGNQPETSMYDEVSSLLKTRLEYHEWQLKHHQQRVNEIQDMYQYLNARFGPQPDADQLSVAQPDAAQPEVVEAPVEETPAAEAESVAAEASNQETHQVAQGTVAADESLLRPYTEPEHQTGEPRNHQPMY